MLGFDPRCTCTVTLARIHHTIRSTVKGVCVLYFVFVLGTRLAKRTEQGRKRFSKDWGIGAVAQELRRGKACPLSAICYESYSAVCSCRQIDTLDTGAAGAAGVVHAGGVWWRVLGAGTFRLLGPPASHGGSRIDAGCLVGQVVVQIATTS